MGASPSNSVAAHPLQLERSSSDRPSVSRIQRHTPTAFIVSLGMFERKRFPDLRAEDANGRALGLLTRFEHGFCLANGMLRKFLSDDEWGRVRTTEVGRTALDSLFPRLASMLTNVLPERDPRREDVLRDLERLLKLLDAHRRHGSTSRVVWMAHAYDQMLTQVQYLCWVPADAGSLVNLRASYTIRRMPRTFVRRAFDSPDHATARTGRFNPRLLHAKWRDFRMRRYASVGLLRPLYYEMRAPAHDHCASY